MNPEGTESTRTVEWLAWLELNKKRLVVGTVVVAALVSAIAIYRWHRSEREAAASAALLKVQMNPHAEAGAKSPPPADFLKVATEFAGTLAAGRARLFAAQGLFEEGRYVDARAAFEGAAREVSDAGLAATAAFGVAACLDALGKTNEAMTAYQDVITRNAGSSVAGQAKLGLAGLYEGRGEPIQALRFYNEMTNLTLSAWAAEALSRRELLLARHPELAPTNPPVAPAPPPTGLNLPTQTVLLSTSAPAVSMPKP